MRLKLKTIFFLCSSEQEILLELNGVPCVKLIHICLTEQHNEVEDIYAPLRRLNQPYDIRWLHLKRLKPVFFFSIPVSGLDSFHKLRLHLGVGRWSEKRVDYYIKSATKGGTWSKNTKKMQT